MPPEDGEPHEGTSRTADAWWKISLAVGALVALTMAWGLVEPHLLDVEEETATVAGLPPEWEGAQIAVLGDFQVGMWLANTDTVGDAVEAVIERRPDAVLLTGDFVYHADADGSEVEAIADLLRPLGESGIPTYGVLGNHDYAMSSRDSEPDEELASRVASRMEALGITMLENEAVAIPGPADAGGPDLHVVGIGSRWAGRDDHAAALGQLPADAPHLVLMHNPESFAGLPAGAAPLAVAGHTHGGQIRLPFTDDWSYLAMMQGDEVHADGWVPDAGSPGDKLYVNRGIGFSLVPLRINCRPEVTVFSLTGSS